MKPLSWFCFAKLLRHLFFISSPRFLHQTHEKTEQGVDTRYDYASVSRWTSDALRHLLANRLAFVPVNVGQRHWILVVIDFELLTITLYDHIDKTSQATLFVLKN